MNRLWKNIIVEVVMRILRSIFKKGKYVKRKENEI